MKSVSSFLEKVTLEIVTLGFCVVAEMSVKTRVCLTWPGGGQKEGPAVGGAGCKSQVC